ncbi:MAG: YhgE/Pip domain-containing protein [Clostridium sp.]|nr:YhgE/Pip domain-containing protein [Clostridium sp.]MDU7084231.1 YhgE/Pip domain-containing protein [Clostridium sp.]
MDDLKQNKSQVLKIIKFIALVGIILIPTIYTTIFLGSMWDPYGKLDNLPVAVVNLDKSCDYNGEELAVGDELVKNLKKDASLNFSFVDKETAQEGLDDGSYYMLITIPENFSYNATTLLNDNPEKMELQYKINPGKNYIASKMSESAIQKITSSIENSVTEVYAKAVFDEISSIGGQLSDAADGATLISEGLTSLKEGSDSISSNLKLLYDSSLTFTDGINTYEAGISQYLSAVAEIQKGSNSLNTGISTLNNKTSTLSEGVDALSTGANSLYTGLQSYTLGVTSLEEGVSKLNLNSNSLVTGANTLDTGILDLQKGSKNLLDGLNALSSSIGNSVNEDNSQNIETLTTSLDGLNKGINTINTTIQGSSSDNLTSAFRDLGTNLSNVGISAQTSSTYINELKTKVDEIKEATWFKALDSTTQAEIIDSLSSPLSSLDNEINNMAAETSSASNNLTSAVNEVTATSNQISAVKTALETLSSNADILLKKAKTTITSSYSGLETVKTTLDDRIIPGVQTINSGVTTLKNGSEKLTSGINTYTSVVNTLSDGASMLNSNSGTLINGSKSLSNGITSLNASVPLLTEGVGQVYEGSNALSQGLNTLSQNNSSLSLGINTINSASTAMSEGVSKLYDGSIELGNGAYKLEEGSESLKDGLEDGSKAIASTKLSDQAKEMFASPVKSVEFFNSYIANNGSAMSAYMMCVGLWVGCLALCILFPTEKDLKNGKISPKEFWSKKVLKLAAIAIVQAIVMVSLIILFNGLDPAYLGRTYLVAISAALSFMTIVYFMNLLLGKVGSFILLVFMVLQLSGSAGTYPIELSSSFFNAIHNYMPFTYAVDGFRNGIATGLSIIPQITILLGIGIICSILSIIIVIKKNKSTKTSLAELIEEAI